MSTSSLGPGIRRLGRSLRSVIPLLLLGAVLFDLGTDPFERSLHVLSPGPIAAALLLGVVTTAAQAMRWRTVAIGYGNAAGLTPSRAMQEYYRSALLNAVLPGGVMGDAIRAWRQRAPRERGLRVSAQAVVGERVSGTVLLMVAVAIVTIPVDLRVSGLMLAGAGVAALIAAPTLKRLPWRGQLAVWGWSALALTSLVTKFAVAAAALGTVVGPGQIITLALIVLAGMSVPVGIGGFGPREAVAAVAFGSVGLSADAGVATAAAFGVLAAVSALPGAFVMLFDRRRRDTAADDTQIEEIKVREVKVREVKIEDTRIDVVTTTVAPVIVRSAAVAPAVVRRIGVARFPELLDLRLVVPHDDRLVSSGVRSSGRGQIEFEADVLTEHEPARRSA